MAVKGTGIDKEEICLIFKSVLKKKKTIPAKQKEEKIYFKKIPQGEKITICPQILIC